MGLGRPTIEGPLRCAHLVDITTHFGSQLCWITNMKNYLAIGLANLGCVEDTRLAISGFRSGLG